MLDAGERFFVGKCQTCRHSMQKDHAGAAGGLLLFCHQIPFNPEQTRAHWTCSFYEYEPGSAG